MQLNLGVKKGITPLTDPSELLILGKPETVKLQRNKITFTCYVPDKNPPLIVNDITRALERTGYFNGIKKPGKS